MTSDGKIVISYHSICNFQGAVKRLFYQPVETKITFDLKSLVNFFFKKSGTHLLSHIVSNIVSSAAYVLTVVFGMGTGVSHRRIGTGISQNLLYQSSIAPPKAPLFSVAVAPLMHLRRVIRSRKQASIASATPHLRNRLLVIEDSTVYKTLTSSSLERR